MRQTLLALTALAAVTGISSVALAEETTVIRRDGPADTVVDRSTTGTVEKKTVTRSSDGMGCGSKTVHKENDLGESKTVHKEGCD
ncbi:hypothetical protein [Methylobacterium sp. ID0610]|uniref:hypothetical protein n=1 Tax=Methylobacterium carpenticola TaxID=3344827 RepID=UPI0036D08919